MLLIEISLIFNFNIQLILTLNSNTINKSLCTLNTIN
jgi:hypothetical protein